ncbi:MAG: PhnD/SsuA/transferrin family substrate-binding protein [Gammaproteobacteria bacterium]|nr:PhnD/SsuA/transferrin family substrate-binding protein [Gammaproteobacteria bacterium]
MGNVSKKFIACGMYAFSDDLAGAWRQLFEGFCELLDAGNKQAIVLRFDADLALLQDAELFLGHTCGYPLMKRLKDQVIPFCVPVFDVPGTDGKLYSSRFIVAANSSIEALDECREKVAAMNAADSNSGMNVLRHAIARLNPSAPFFSRVVQTGSHLNSLKAVADGTTDVAAIDCVSYQLIQDHWPELVAKVRSIGFSVKTCGLPLVLPRSSIDDADLELLVKNLNQALADIPESSRIRLHLRGFEPVTLEDYQPIVELENFAIDSGYPRLI